MILKYHYYRQHLQQYLHYLLVTKYFRHIDKFLFYLHKYYHHHHDSYRYDPDRYAHRHRDRHRHHRDRHGGIGLVRGQDDFEQYL